MFIDALTRNGRLLAAVALGALGNGCRGFDAEAPAGFAAYDDWSQFRAVSANGIMYRVRTGENEPQAKLKFWSEALKKRMLDTGYAFIRDGAIKAGNEPGYLLELAAPVGQQDYSFLVAVFVRGSDLIIAEAAGEVTRFAKHRDAVVAAIGKIR